MTALDAVTIILLGTVALVALWLDWYLNLRKAQQ